MYAVTSTPLESRTRATLRSAEFGFLGVIVLTTVQTPRFCGQPCMAGCFGLLRCGCRGALINWLIVGIRRNPARPPNGSSGGNQYVSGSPLGGKAPCGKVGSSNSPAVTSAPDKGTWGQGDKGEKTGPVSSPPCLLVPMSPCP